MQEYILWLGWICGVLAVLAWWKAEQHRVAVRRSLMPEVSGAKETKEQERLPGWLLRASESMATRAGSLMFGGDQERWERLLVLAGSPYGLTPQLFGGMRLVLATFGLLGGNLFLVLGIPFPLGAVLVFGGYFGPVFWLRSRARSRQARIGRELPDFLDTVACALDAGGLGLDQALERARPYFGGPLGEEFGRLHQEISLGMPRQQAFRRLLQRTESPELELLVNSLIQADSIGAPVATAFSIQAADIRSHRAQTAQELAAKVEAKLTAVGTLILAPVSLVFILALMVLNVMYNPAFGGWRSLW